MSARLSARTAVAAVTTALLAASALALSAGAAHADPDDTAFTPATGDVIGVGSDTSQNAMYRLAEAYNATVPAGNPRLATFAAVGSAQITLPSGAINRPNGSGAGKTQLYNPSNPDIDYARSSSTLSTTEISAGLQQFPFALDTLKLAVSGDTASKAPDVITAQQMVGIYDGSVDDWSDIGGQPGAIVPMIPQAGSGTRSFFVAQLKAANNNVDVALASTVVEVQEHDAAPVRGNATAVAPFSVGRAAPFGSSLRLTGGFSATRALYNVVRSTDLGNATIQGLFGTNGFLCSDGAQDEIAAAGFLQLARPANGGACGQSTQSAVSNFTLNGPVAPVSTTTTVTGTSPSPRAVSLKATVSGSPTPTGRVTFTDATSGASLGTANLIGGVGTLNLSNRAPGSYRVTAAYAPPAESTFVASQGTGTVVAKAASTITESLPASVAKTKASAKGAVTVTYVGTTTKPQGKVTIKKGAKTVGSGTLVAGRVTVTVQRSAVGYGTSTLKVAFPGDARGFGSTTTFTLTFRKK
ncbi:hypothetical protein GCM10023340_37090 [Nocardioides marinquilinus]|uniref:PBP domain-containing protein n=1 Tax=Nocardioides marinquilinus TaxID=1210400 RepID=A0ABP9Q0L0_9ACTN